MDIVYSPETKWVHIEAYDLEEKLQKCGDVEERMKLLRVALYNASRRKSGDDGNF